MHTWAMAVVLHQLLLVAAPRDEERPFPPSLDAAVSSNMQRVTALRRELHRHPELPNREFRTGKLLAERLLELGLEVRYPVAKTGVVGVLRGRRNGRVVALRAAIDAVPLQEERSSPYKSELPGVMHACGHDAQTALLIGTAEVLAGLGRDFPGTVVFVFQPAEEGPPQAEEGGAALMLKEQSLADPVPEAIIGFHVDPTLDTGTVGWTDGALFASSDRFEIEIRGAATHSAYPHTGIDPLPAAAEIIQAVRALVPGQVERPTSAVASVGTVRGGSAFNLIADHVLMEGALRASGAEARVRLRKGLEHVVHQTAMTHRVTATLRFVGERTAPTVNDPRLAHRLRSSLVSTYGKAGVFPATPQMASEDFSAFAERFPGFYFLLGVRNRTKGLAEMTHTPRFDLDEDALFGGLKVLVRLTWDLLTAGL